MEEREGGRGIESVRRKGDQAVQRPDLASASGGRLWLSVVRVSSLALLQGRSRPGTAATSSPHQAVLSQEKLQAGQIPSGETTFFFFFLVAQVVRGPGLLVSCVDEHEVSWKKQPRW